VSTTAAGSPVPAGARSGVPFRALVRSELTKILSTRLWWALLVGAVIYTMLQSGATAALSGVRNGAGQGSLPPLSSAVAIRSIYAGSAFSGAYIFALVLGVTGMTGEHRYQTATPTFLATPRRARVVLAKSLSHVAVGICYGVVAVLTALLVGGVVIAIRGHSPSLGAEGLWRALLLAVLAVGVWTMVGIGIGTMIRNQIAAIMVAVAVTFLVEPLVSLGLHAGNLDSVGKFLPSSASSAMTSPSSPYGELLPWWGGALVLLGYALAFAAAGIVLTVRRDVT
jgi:ABC-type transport system involved in multi-copper enzyme maturation permease subunit